MSFSDILEDVTRHIPSIRGRLSTNILMSSLTWFQVGGPAQLLFNPADEDDLIYFLKSIPADLEVNYVGLGSNLIVRDGGIPGVVIKLGKGFHKIELEKDVCLRVGAGMPDVKVSRAAAENSLSGFEFLRGIPGSIGGALRMNAGAHGSEIKDIFIEARAIDRQGNLHVLNSEDMGFSYRHCNVPKDWIFTECVLKGTPGNRAKISELMEEVANYRETHQPIKSRTGGSTFKNPNGQSAWKLVDQAGCRGLQIGGAQVSEMHCNFLINTGQATADDLETLGETVRERVRAISDIELQWEIRRIGLAKEELS